MMCAVHHADCLFNVQVTIGDMWVETVPGGTLTFSAAAAAVSASFYGSEWNVLVSLMFQNSIT